MLEFGRICLGGLSVIGGMHNLFERKPLSSLMQARGVPLPRLALLAGSVFQILAGALLMADLFTVTAALGLVIFTIATTVMFLPYWNLPLGPAREHAINGLLANTRVIGGLLLAA